MANNWDMETGVLVIGAGGCGLTAAIAAHDAGADVAVVEKLDRAGRILPSDGLCHVGKHKITKIVTVRTVVILA